ncbi:MAG: plasmid pRiA4b ORF-3 family protein [Candidatus Accumulibacter sp.]|jgi:hypothetical protein|nr:plasmid pRiA4b ORF-3 family protein [Accumulibacter sp.]
MNANDAPRSPQRRTAPALLQLKIELAWLRPTIWRRIVVPETIRLGKLHEVIQVVMGWSDSHLHEFEIDGERYGIANPDFGFGDSVRSERTARLGAVLNGKKTFRYVYDFGDDWEHRIKVEKTLPPDVERKTALCLAGANACPPDDVGGPPGYENFIEAIADPDHPEHEEMLDWVGGSFNPAAFDLERINALLGKIRL